MIVLRRHWPIWNYLITFMIAALTPAFVFTYFFSLEASNIQSRAREQMRGEAVRELKGVMLHESAEIRQVASNLAAWEETIAQLADPSYYPYWRQSRVRDVGRFQTLFDGVELYDRQGRALAQDPLLPASVLTQATDSPGIVNEKGVPSLIYFMPVKVELRARPVLVGYVGIRADINRIIQKEHVLTHADPETVTWDIAPGVVKSVEDAVTTARAEYRELPEVHAFAQLAQKSFRHYLAYIVLMLAVITVLLVTTIAYPLRRLAGHIKDVQENRIRELPEEGLVGVTELASIRDAVNDYRNRFQEATAVLVEKNEELLVLTYRDTLTGAYNRRAFELHLKMALESARHDNRQHALCYIDLDQFKIVNDTCGHVAGDELLKQVSSRLQSVVRDSDMVARLGGDEFGILLDSCNETKAVEIAEKICDALRKFRFLFEDKVFDVGGSIGVVPINADNGDVSDVLRAADSACYLAKDRGRGRVQVFQPDDEDLAQRYGEMQWVTRITRALEENRFELYCQGIVPVSNSELTPHFEILLRLRENGELVPPMAFLPAAERYNLITRLDQMVITTAIETLQSITGSGGQLSIAINISGQSLGDAQFLDFVIHALGRPGLDPRTVTFEITETAAITNLIAATRFIDTLRDIGVRFSLDDFGTGLSSFSYLKNLKVDFLKIDGHFVRNIAHDPVSHSMVEAINKIGHVMGIMTIAEFVEDKQTLERLRDIGIDFAQGYAIDNPAPFTALAGNAVDPRTAAC